MAELARIREELAAERQSLAAQMEEQAAERQFLAEKMEELEAERQSERQLLAAKMEKMDSLIARASTPKQTPGDEEEDGWCLMRIGRCE